jgi:hypothetical protein
MNDSEFQVAVLALAKFQFREEFESALSGLYRRATESQRFRLREGYNRKTLGEPTVWRNPADYGRSDLTREQRLWKILLEMSLQETSPDYRDDLMAIAFCYHNFALMGVDADAVLAEVAGLSGPEFAKLVVEFIHRSPVDKGPEAFALKLGMGIDGAEEFTFG